MIDLAAPFRRKKAKRLYFAVVLSDRPTDGFLINPDKDCTMFVANGETTPGLVIPPTVLKEMVERFEKDPAQMGGKVIVSEEKV